MSFELNKVSFTENSLHCLHFSHFTMDQKKHHQSSAWAFPEFLSFWLTGKFVRCELSTSFLCGTATAQVWCHASVSTRNLHGWLITQITFPGVNKLHPVRSCMSQTLQNVLNKPTLYLPLKLNFISFLYSLIVFWSFYLRDFPQRHAWTSYPSLYLIPMPTRKIFPCPLMLTNTKYTA